MSNEHNGSTRRPSVLQRASFAGLDLESRAAVSPMTRVSATLEGTVIPRMVSYYQAFADGGFGLVITEGIYTDSAASQAYADQPGLVTDAHVDGWRSVTQAVHGAGVPIFAQLMHAGALSQVLSDTVAPSAGEPLGEKMPIYGGTGPFPLPRAMSHSDLDTAIAGFAQAAAHAAAAGFDGVEIHAANGYLIDQFITDYTNKRADHYGGATADRTRFTAEVLHAVRRAVGTYLPVGIRLSQGKVNDPGHRWAGGAADAAAIFTAVAEAGADFIHIASEGQNWVKSATLAEGKTITQLARDVTGLPVIANGGMHDPIQAETVLRDGHGDLVSLGRGALANPDWPHRVRGGHDLADFDTTMLTPKASIENADAWAEQAG